MRRCLFLLVGVVIGQWLAFAGIESPSTVYRMAHEASARSDWSEAARQWSRAVSLQPHNVYFNYMRGASLARLGHRHAAADALQLTLLLGPDEALAGQIRHELASLARPTASGADESVVSLEWDRGVWIARVHVNGAPSGRFLLDTGSSVTILSPAFARAVGANPRERGALELDTVNGRTQGALASVRSLRLGRAEVSNADIVIIEPPRGGLDGILGNSFLSHWDVSLDPDRRVLRLRRPSSSSDAAAHAAGTRETVERPRTSRSRHDTPAALPRVAR